MKRQLTHLDFEKISQILNAIIHKIPQTELEAVLTAAGQLGYDSDNNYPVYFDGTSVQRLFSTKDKATSFTQISDAYLPTVKAVADYVSSVVSAGVRIRGQLTRIGAIYPPIPFPNPIADEYLLEEFLQTGDGSGLNGLIKTGDAWYISGLSTNEDVQIGTIGTPKLITNGALVIARVDNPGNDVDNWIVLENTVPDATELVQGIVRLATQSEVDFYDIESSEFGIVTNKSLAKARTNTINGGFARRTVVREIDLIANTPMYLNIVRPLETIETIQTTVFDENGNELEVSVTVSDKQVVLESLVSISNVRALLVY